MPALAAFRAQRIVPLPAPRAAAGTGSPARWLAVLVVGLLLATIAVAARGAR